MSRRPADKKGRIDHMRTIVGGRPRKDTGPGGGVARGIDVLLLKGAVDPVFCEVLGRDWRAAAASIELTLTESEARVLASIPGDVLVSMAARMRVPKAHRPVFLGKAAAAMLALAAVLGTAACSPPPPRPVQVTPWPGTDPEVNEPDHWQERTWFVAGIAPEPDERTQDFESEDEGVQPGDQDPATVNEPEVWDPPVPMFGIAPEWNERTHDYESEDEDR